MARLSRLWAFAKRHKRALLMFAIANEIRGLVSVGVYLWATNGRLLP